MEPALEARLDELVRRHDELRAALSATGLSGSDFANSVFADFNSARLARLVHS